MVKALAGQGEPAKVLEGTREGRRFSLTSRDFAPTVEAEMARYQDTLSPGRGGLEPSGSWPLRDCGRMQGTPRKGTSVGGGEPRHDGEQLREPGRAAGRGDRSRDPPAGRGQGGGEPSVQPQGPA